MSARDDRRRRSAWRTLVPSERERRTYLDRGMPPESIVATGYVKAGFRQRTDTIPVFAEPRPILLYNPHWQAHRSSWWRWGAQVVRRVLADGRWNLIFAPHQRLAERAPEVRALCAELAGRGDVLCDYESFAAVDGSYTAAADLYLGDTSSQLLEFVMAPRPCLFLDAHGVAWQEDPSYAMWACGEVITTLDALLPALARAPELHGRYTDVQTLLAEDSLGDTSGRAPARAAGEVLHALRG